MSPIQNFQSVRLWLTAVGQRSENRIFEKIKHSNKYKTFGIKSIETPEYKVNIAGNIQVKLWKYKAVGCH